MAMTILQNCQRATLLLQFLTILTVVILLTVRLIKKRIDISSRPSPSAPAVDQGSQSAGDKYKDPQTTQQQFQSKAVGSLALSDDDTCTDRFIKKVSEYNVYFSPMWLTLGINFITGRNFAFSIAIFVIAALLCWLLNVFKVHRACVQNKFGRWGFQMLWMIGPILLLVNFLSISPNTMLYNLRNG